MLAAGLASELEEHDCRALLIIAESSRDPALAAFAGGRRLGPCFVIATADQTPRLGYLTPMERDEAAATGLDLLTPEALDVARWLRDGAPAARWWADVLSTALQLCGLGPAGDAGAKIALAGRAGLGTMFVATHVLAQDGWSFADGEMIARRLRKTKNKQQVARLRRQAALSDRAFRQIGQLLALASADGDGRLTVGSQPLRVGELRRLAARIFASHGLQQPEGNIIAPAEQGAVPHSVGDDGRQLRTGESLIVDLFPRGELYTDCTRTFCHGTPPSALRRAYGKVVEALELAESMATSGVVAWSLQASVCELFESAGYPTPIDSPGSEHGYVHGLGHGVGYELHELPVFSQNADHTEGALAEGDVITLEPGLYQPTEGWAVRVEDLYSLTANGLERLTRAPRHLDVESLQLSS